MDLKHARLAVKLHICTYLVMPRLLQTDREVLHVYHHYRDSVPVWGFRALKIFSKSTIFQPNYLEWQDFDLTNPPRLDCPKETTSGQNHAKQFFLTNVIDSIHP